MSDEIPDLYALALAAHKETRVDGNTYNVEVALKAWAVVALSFAEAEAKGLTYALELWPLGEGFTKHNVGVSIIERAFITESLLEMDTFGVDESGDDDDVVM